MLHEAVQDDDAFSIAVIDADMPVSDGFELARSIRAADELRPLKLVLLRAAGQRGDARAARDVGTDAYLTKPVHRRALHDCLTMVLAQDGATARGPLVTRHTLAEVEAQDKPRVLMVDDNQINQKIAVLMLGRLGYRADVAVDGIEAVDPIDRTDYHAVLMDCEMPRMDGYTATPGAKSSAGADAVLVEADCAGGDLAALLGLHLDPGIVSLAAACRHHSAAPDPRTHGQRLPTGGWALVGSTDPTQASAALSTPCPTTPSRARRYGRECRCRLWPVDAIGSHGAAAAGDDGDSSVPAIVDRSDRGDTGARRRSLGRDRWPGGPSDRRTEPV